MDALEFVRERNRMCDSFGHISCGNCPAEKHGECVAILWDEEIVPIVEKWSKEHSRKTRQDAVLEQWPNAETRNDNVLSACPKVFDRNFVCHFEDEIYNTCSDCRRKFWMQEVE